MKKIALLIIVSCYIISCTNPSSNKIVIENKDSTVVITNNDTITKTSEIISLADFKKLVIALKSNDDNTFKAFVDGGVISIYSNGAMPSIKTANTIKEIENLNLHIKALSESYTEAELPKVDCSGNLFTGYTKDGCFASKAILLNADVLKYCENADEDLKRTFASKLNSIVYTVLDTNGVTYYFSHENGKWILVFIDTRTPCNA